MIKYHNLKQNTEEWFAIRKGKMTASNAQAIGNADKGLSSYIIEILSDKLATKSDTYTNPDIERGKELEDNARQLYAKKNKVKVKECGFVENDAYSNAGCSPDGLISTDGLIEIKCPNNFNYVKLLLEPEVKSEYMWQIQMQLLITEREWCDYVCYNENFKNNIIIQRVLPNKEMQDKIIIGLEKGNQLLEELNNKLK